MGSVVRSNGTGDTANLDGQNESATLVSSGDVANVNGSNDVVAGYGAGDVIALNGSTDTGFQFGTGGVTDGNGAGDTVNLVGQDEIGVMVNAGDVANVSGSFDIATGAASNDLINLNGSSESGVQYGGGSVAVNGSGDTATSINGMPQQAVLDDQTMANIDAIYNAVLDRDPTSADLVSAETTLASGGGPGGLMSAVANSAESLADMTSTYAAEGVAAPGPAKFAAFADAMSTSYDAPMELDSVDPYNGQRTELADTSDTNLLAELPVLETQADGVNLGLTLADGRQLQFASTDKLADFLYAVSVQQMQATQFVTDNYNLDMQWLNTVDQPLLNEAVGWNEQAAAEVALGVANAAQAGGSYAGAIEAGPNQLAAEYSTEASLALKIAAEAPSSRQDMSVTIKNVPNDATTQVTVYANGSGGAIHDISGSIWQEIEGAITAVVEIAAVVTGNPYLYYAAAAIDAAQAGQDFSNGEDLSGILSAAAALSAGIIGGTGGTLPLGTTPPPNVALTPLQTAAQAINIGAEAVGGVYGVVQSAENGNAVGILDGVLEAAAAAAAGIGASYDGSIQQTATLVSEALTVASVATNVGSDFASGNVAQGLVDSLNGFLPALALANQAWANGSGPTTQGAATSTVPAQKISLALTQDGDLPLVALAVAESELMNGPIPNGTELTRQDAAVLEAQLASSEGSAVSELLAVDATVTFTGDGELLADGPADGTETATANMMTITLPAVESNSGLINPSFTLSSPNPNTVLVAGPGAPTGASTAGPGAQNNIPTIIVTPDNSGYNLNTSGNSATSGTQPSSGSGGSSQSGSGGGGGSTSTLPDDGSGSSGGASATSDTVTVNFGNSISQALMAFIPTPAAVQAPSPTTPAQLANQAKAQAALHDPKVWAFLQAITWAEGGGYNQLFKYPGQINSTFADMSTHPPAVVYNGNPYSAAGAYMIEIGLWADLSVQLGLYDFTASTQNLMAAQELIDKNVVGLIDKGDVTDAAAALTGVWAALPNAGNQSHITPQQFQSTYSTFLNAH